MYPRMMLEAVPDFSCYEWRRYREGMPGVLECEMEIPSSYIAPLPQRGEKLFYPVGRVTGIWPTTEIENAVACGAAIRRVGRFLHYPRVHPFLKSFVESIYKLRAEAVNPTLKKIFKIFMNSLYGKFGQGNMRTVLVSMDGRESGVVWGDRMIKEVEGKYPAFSNVIWSAWLTALARIKLVSMLKECGDGLCYCDTDSVVYSADRALFDEGDALGAVSLEGRFESGYFLAPKFYALFSKDTKRVRAKGVPQRLAEEFLFNQRVEYKRPLRLRESLVRGIHVNTWTVVPKEVQSDYHSKVERGGRLWPRVIGC